MVGNTKIELLEATEEYSTIAKFIHKKSEGVHHIAFTMEDLGSGVKRLKEEGFEILNEQPKKEGDNKLVVFLHPETANGVLVEWCQETK